MATPTPSLPMDAIEHILSWLPVKSVLQYRSVSKSWSSLTRTLHFLYLHHLRSNTRTNLLLLSYREPSIRNKRNILDIDVYSTCSSSLTLFNTLTHHQNSTSLQCCDGVIAMHPPETLLDSKISISNPSTTETLDIPFNTRVFQDYECVSSYVGFEPVAKRYKLMIMATWHKVYSNTKHCEIVTLGTENDDWREVDVTGTPPIEDGSGTCFSFNGALHWLSSDYRKRELLSFDLKSEEFRTITGPELVQNDPATWKLCEVDGCLTLAEFGVYKGDLKLWMLRDYENNVWVERTIFVSSPKVFGQCVDVVGSINDDEVLISTKSREPEMICYDVKAKTCRDMEVRGTRRRFDEGQFTMLHRESMVPLQT